MYKVFINDKPIILTSSLKNNTKFPLQDFDPTKISEIVLNLENDINLKGVILHSKNLKKDWTLFLSCFKVLTAAGGLVLNEKNEILCIYRLHKWDLPKGKVEKNEKIEDAAIREVEEECGVKNLKINKFLISTYHIYHQKEYIIKETHWFLMNTAYSKQLTPQLEEDITKVAFISPHKIDKILNDSYANIQLVYNSYKAE